MDHEEIERSRSTHNPDPDFHDETLPPDPGEPSLVEEQDEQPKGLMNVFKAAFQKAKRERMQAAGVSKRELGRDKSKSFILFAVVAVILFIAFLGLFSTRSKTPAERAVRPTTPNLGRKVDPNQTDTSKSLAPLLSADTHAIEQTTGGEVTPADVDRTAHPIQTPPQGSGSSSKQTAYPAGTRQDYALKGINFADTGTEQQGSGGTLAPPPAEVAVDTKSPDLKKPSLVFIRQSAPDSNRESAAMVTPQGSILGTLPVGTRLIARLQAPVSSAVSAPVVAVVEYNYERNGEIVVPAGAKVIGRLGQVSQTGYVGIQFERIEMPDGASEKVDASAMDLTFTPLKGVVSGRNNGTKFLVRSLTGIGTFASYLVGPHGTNGINGPISENALLRERLADNVSTAGQDKLNSLATNQSIVVTVPGNTRFFIVLQKGNSDQGTSAPKVNNANAPAGGTRVPSVEELRQLLQLRQEINHVYEQANAEQAPQQQ